MEAWVEVTVQFHHPVVAQQTADQPLGGTKHGVMGNFEIPGNAFDIQLLPKQVQVGGVQVKEFDAPVAHQILERGQRCWRFG